MNNNQDNSDLVLRLKNAFDMLPNPIFIKDGDCRYIACNRAFESYIGLPSEKIINSTVYDVSPPELAEIYDKADRDLLSKGGTQSYEANVRYADGSYHDVIFFKSIFYNAESKNDGISGMILDITERKIIETKVQRSEAEYRHFVQMLPYGVLIHKDGKILLANQSAAQMFGATNPDQLIGMSPLSFVHTNYRELVISRINAAVDHGKDSGKIDEKLLRLDGSEFDAEVASISILFDNKPASLAVFNDITQRKKDEDALRLAATVYQNSSEGMMITDANNQIIAINPAFTFLTGYTPEDVLGKQPNILQSGKHSKEFYENLWAQLGSSGHWDGEIWNQRKDGGIYIVHMVINVEKHEDGSVHRYIGLFADITDQKKKEELIWCHANYDSLTGLPNRRLFLDRLEQETKKVRRIGNQLSLLFIDLDRFKEVNDALGHSKGDILLVEATRRLKNCVRDSDTIARLGGDEFTIILPGYDNSVTIDRIAHHILSEMAKQFDLGDGDVCHISASIGITLYPKDTTNLNQLLQYADQAMYAAKIAGRNGVSYFTSSMQNEAQEKMTLINDLRQALGRGELEVYYQPIIEALSGEIVKAEALLRWHHPTRGMINPAAFIPLAEESGLIVEIGEWVFEEVIQTIKSLEESTDRLLQVSVNKSPVQFIKSESDSWLKQLEDSGLPRGCITVEITEGLLLSDSTKVKNELINFKRLGIEVSIDDFGTGFSALSYLNRFDIDYLKIDKSFVQDMNESHKALTEAIVVMAHKLNIKTIAEGVETAEQRDQLISFGCDYLQGFLYSKPVPLNEFKELLR